VAIIGTIARDVTNAVIGGLTEWDPPNAAAAGVELTPMVEHYLGQGEIEIGTASGHPVEAQSRGLLWNNDGTALYHIASVGDQIEEITLGTAYDIGDYSSTDSGTAFGLGAIDQTDVAMSSDGLLMSLNRATHITQYSLTAAWDMSTMGTADYSLALASLTANTGCTGHCFNSDGSKLWALDQTDNTMHRYTVTSGGFDLSGGVVSDAVSVDLGAMITLTIGQLRQVNYNEDGTRMAVLDFGNDHLFIFDLSTAYDPSSATLQSETDIGAAYGISNPAGVVFLPDDVGVVVSDIDAIFEIRWNGSVTELMSYGTPAPTTYDSMETAYGAGTKGFGIALNSNGETDPGGVEYVVSELLTNFESFDMGTPGDITTSSSVGTTTNAAADIMADFCLSPDGLKMWYVEVNDRMVFEATLTTAWDVSSAGAFASVHTFDTGIAPTGIALSPDGRWGVLGDNAYRIRTFELLTPWDFSTLRMSTQFYQSSGTVAARGLDVTPDGAFIVHTCEAGTNNIRVLPLDVPFQVSRAGTEVTHSSDAANSQTSGCAMDVHRKKLYVVDRSDCAVHQYTWT